MIEEIISVSGKQYKLSIALTPEQRNDVIKTIEQYGSIQTVGSIHINDEFINGNYQTNWGCEYGCPYPSSTTKTDLVEFRLKAGASLNTNNSWSKLYLKNYYNRMSYGIYSARFMVNRVPYESEIWYGMALWEKGPAPYNEVMIGYYTKDIGGGVHDERIDMYCQKDSNFDNYVWKTSDNSAYKMSRLVNTWHELKFIYNSTHIEFYFDGVYINNIINTAKIPTKPMTLTIGARVAKYPLLSKDFIAKCDYARINAQIV